MLIRILKPLSFIPAILLMYMIFSFSAQDGTTSSNLSYQVSYKIVEAGSVILDADLQPSEISALAERFNGVVRKLAHMTEYFALAVAVAFPLYVYGLHGFPLMLTAGFFCVLFACGDEYHQSFVDDRGPSVRDVLIDSFGVFWGIILVRIIGWTGRHTIFRPFNHKKRRAKEEAAAAQNPYSGAPQGYRDAQPGNGYGSYGTQPGAGYGGYGTQPGAGYGTQPGAGYGGYGTQSGAGYGGYGPQTTGSYNTQATNNPYSPQPGSKKKKRQNQSDSLSEDMSLKNLIHNLRDSRDE